MNAAFAQYLVWVWGCCTGLCAAGSERAAVSWCSASFHSGTPAVSLAPSAHLFENPAIKKGEN